MRRFANALSSPTDGQRRSPPGRGPWAKSRPPTPLPDRPGCASAAAGPPGTTSPPRRPVRESGGRRADRLPVVGTVSPAMIHASVDLPEPLPPWISKPSPWCTTKLTSRSAVLAHGVPLPYSCPTPASSSTGAPDVVTRRRRSPPARPSSRPSSVLSPDSLRLIDAVRGIGFVVVVRDVNQRRPVPLRQPGQHAEQRVPALLVDHAGDLVGDEQRGLPRQRGGHRQPLQLAARQTAGVAFARARRARPR